MKKLFVFSGLLALAFAALATPASAQFTPVGSLLFQDTYNYGATWVEDLNYGINSPSRVAGPLAGQVSYDTANMVGVRDIDGPNLKMDLSDGGYMESRGCVGLTKDFNGDLALGGLTVCVSVNGRAGLATLGVGHNGSAAANIGDTYFDPANYFLVPGFYTNVFGADIANLATTTFGADGTSEWFRNYNFSGPFGDSYVELAMVFTDETDSNPFNGSGLITAQVYANGALVTTATGPDFAHNYISFQGATTQWVSFANLRVYGNAAAVPEPGTLALLAAAGGLACVWFRRRR